MADATYNPTCDFCRIAAGAEEATIVFEDEHAMAFAPLEPAARGHTLVIPKGHVKNFLDASLDTVGYVMSALQIVVSAVDRALAPDGFNIITSAGRAASQTVFHLHFHVVPRWQGDRMGDIWPPTTKQLEASQEDVSSMIREAIQDPGE